MSDTSATPTAPEAGATPPAAPAAPAAAPAATPDASDHFVPQKDVDRIIGERLGRERQKLDGEYAQKIEDAKKAERESVTKEFHGTLVESKVESLAKDLGFHDPKDGLTVIDKDKLPMKDGKPDEDAIKTLLEGLVKSKPYLAKADDGKKSTPAPKGKPKMPEGNKNDGDGEHKITAAEALRQLAAQRKH